MPKTYITLEERNRAEAERKYKAQNIFLSAALREAVKHKFTYEELAKAAGVNKSTVQKAFNNPEKMRIDLLRKICYAAGIFLSISGADEKGA